MSSPLDKLHREPSRFTFDAAVRLLQHAAHTADPAAATHFASPPNLAYPSAEVTAVTTDERDGETEMTTTVMGLVGPSGVLPRGYTEAVTVAERDRSPSLHAFFDLLADRFVAHFAGAGGKYRPHRAAETAMLGGNPDPVRGALLALIGYSAPDLAGRLACGEALLLHYGGFFASRPRSADRLAALASDWLDSPVAVEQFVGAWLDLPPDQRSALPRGRDEGNFCRLGVDAAIGVRAWDMQAKVVLRVGPLTLPEFEALLPGGLSLTQFVALVRAFLGVETGFAVNLVLGREAVPPLRLQHEAAERRQGPRLGWNSWLPAPVGARMRDADEAVFDAEVVEAETARLKAA